MRTSSQIAEEIAMIGPRIGRRVMADLLHVADLPPAQIFVVIFLFHHGPCHACDVSKEFRVSAPTATGIIDRLETGGYVSRIADEGDRRAVVVELTAEGRKVAQRLRTVIIDRWTELLSRLSSEDAEKYLEILQKINEAL